MSAQERPANHFCIKKCPSCGKYMFQMLTSDAIWHSAVFASDGFIQLCILQIQSELHVDVERADFLYLSANKSRFSLSITFRQGSLIGSYIIWFTVEPGQCHVCLSFPDQISIQHASRVEITSLNDRTEPLIWLRKQISSANGGFELDSSDFSENKLAFFFSHPASAFNFVNFIRTLISVSMEESTEMEEKLCHVFSLKCPAIWVDDLATLSNGSLSVCTSVSKSLSFVNPATGDITEMEGSDYWAEPKLPVLSESSMTIYKISGITLLGPSFGRVQIADVEISDGGSPKIVRSHLGFSLKIGERCLCYDLERNGVLEESKIGRLLIVKAFYPKLSASFFTQDQRNDGLTL